MQTVGYKQPITNVIFAEQLKHLDTGEIFADQQEVVLRSDAQRNIDALQDEIHIMYEKMAILQVSNTHFKNILVECADIIGEDAYGMNMDGIFNMEPDYSAIPDLLRKMTKRKAFWRWFFGE